MSALLLAYLGDSALSAVTHKIPQEQQAEFAQLQQNPNFAIAEVFFARLQQPLSVAEEQQLRRLLHAPGNFDTAAVADSALIIPHPGVVSPWASKAGDILHHCGLTAIMHIERGLLIYNGGECAEWLADRMLNSVLRPPNLTNWQQLFHSPPPKPPQTFTTDSLANLNQKHGWALSASEIAHLQNMYKKLKRQPNDAEMMMFAQANSEHCRHKIFRAAWQDGGESLMNLIRQTHLAAPDGVITAFADNAAVVCAAAGVDFCADKNGVYGNGDNLLLVAKAETHNHPTAISPFAGAATGSGGEIRDEAAAGRGATTRAGFTGFMVSHLPFANVYESKTAAECHAAAKNLASPLAIMIEAPLGAANYGNEFGRPALAGFFRSYESTACARRFGFHKPLMLAGGFGHMGVECAGKKPIPPGAKIVQLGGPGFRLGIGGGAASSRGGGGDDFASVQRDNAEMQRRAQEVIDTCRRNYGDMILSLHDVGAGGLANAVMEIVHDAKVGAHIWLSAIPVQDQSLSAAEIWCNESQERYVLAMTAEWTTTLAAICARENCPFAIIGEATAAPNIVLSAKDGAAIVDLPLSAVLDDIPQPAIDAVAITKTEWNGATMPFLSTEQLNNICRAVLRHPTVACKRFLITIGDRTVGGLTARDQMIGPWQIPVADCAAFFNDYDSFGGAVFALGERAGVAALDAAAGARMAIAESLSNLAAAAGNWQDIKLSLNWLANCASDCGELRTAVVSAADFCLALNIGVVVGKDSLFMRATAEDGHSIESPTMNVAAAFMPSADVRQILTPQLSTAADTFLFLIEPSGQRRLGGGVFAEIVGGHDAPPDIVAADIDKFWRAIAECHAHNLILAYHDRSDGGLWATACEMAFAANCGVTLVLDSLFPAAQTDGGEKTADVNGQQIWTTLFNEEIGALLEVASDNAAQVLQIFADYGLAQQLQSIGRKNAQRHMRIYGGGQKLLDCRLDDLRQEWDLSSYEIARRRDNAACAAEEHARDFAKDGGLFSQLPPNFPIGAPYLQSARPRVAIVREQGVNGQREMAAAFTRAGFVAVDITMSDLRARRQTLSSAEFCGMALCGGFSFGDVLGGGRGWAEAILQNPALSDMFAEFFAAPNTFAFGACNGCQALAQLQPLMAAAETWQFPRFVANHSRRFEARLVMTEILPSPSPMFMNMAGAILPVVSSHAEGRARFDESAATSAAAAVMRFVDANGAATTQYPHNPNGSVGGCCGFCSPDGRITLTMPHPERVFRGVQMSWKPPEWEDNASPWLQMFINARRFVN